MADIFGPGRVVEVPEILTAQLPEIVKDEPANLFGKVFKDASVNLPSVTLPSVDVPSLSGLLDGVSMASAGSVFTKDGATMPSVGNMLSEMSVPPISNVLGVAIDFLGALGFALGLFALVQDK